MIQVSTRADLRRSLDAHRKQAHRVALVPTMGNIHAGHLQLVNSARSRADFTAVSIFVNPTQFDQAEDFQHYPRTLDADLEQLAAANVDLVFTPEVDQLYPHGDTLQAQVEAPAAAQGLEGGHRPGHFRGVATVVCKLFNLFRPDVAVFGKKDYQQLAVINAMVDELFLPVKIVAEETLREADNLALSSRNSRLTTTERQIAPELFKVLQKAAEELTNDSDLQALEHAATAALTKAGFRVDYVSIRDRALKIPDPNNCQLVILAAAALGKVRLIDNLEAEKSPPVVVSN